MAITPLSLRFDGLYRSDHWTESIKVGDLQKEKLHVLFWRFYPDGTALGLEFTLPFDIHSKARLFKRTKFKRDDIFWYRCEYVQDYVDGKYPITRTQIAIGSGNRVSYQGTLEGYSKDDKADSLELYGPGEKYSRTYHFSRVDLPHDTATEAPSGRLPLQPPASSTPIRTHPPSVAAPMQTHPLPPSAPQAVSQLKDEGERYFQASRYDLALPIYEQILHINPTDDYAHYCKGICLDMLGSHDLALAAYEQACHISPVDPIYHLSKGKELLELSRLQEALQAFEQCLQIEPQMGSYSNLRAWQMKSQTLQKLGRMKEAQEAEQYYEQSHQLYVGGRELQLQAPASSAPIQTLPSSTFAQEPVTHMPYKIGTIFVTYQQPGSKVNGLAWSPDGRRIASFGLGEAQVWVPLSGNILYDYKAKGFATIITAITWSPDSTRVATAGSDKVVQIWDANDGHILTAYKGHHKFIRGVSWSPNGQHIASCEDTELHIWNAVSGQDILTFTAHPKTLVGMRSLAWSPDATRIATGGGDNHVTVWDPHNGSPIYTYTQQRNTINGLAWSPDGKRIVSGSADKTVHIWAAETGADPVICQGHTKAVNTVAFSPDGKRIASASDDTTVRIWSSETGQLLFTYEGHKKSVNALAWSPDGKYNASGGDDKIVQVWASDIP